MLLTKLKKKKPNQQTKLKTNWSENCSKHGSKIVTTKIVIQNAHKSNFGSFLY